MRRKEREIKAPAEIEEILRKGQFCRLGMADGGMPYVVPVCYGYENKALYFHCAREGRKMEILRKNSSVCVEVSIDTEIKKKEAACNWGLQYRSVIGFGKAVVLEDERERLKGLSIIMRQYGNNDPEFQPEVMKRTALVKVSIETISGKKAGY